jgi:3-hydroxyisobutyrate dehydrogenase-like beta-hydroxyacid dehydrogenase
MPSQRVAWIGLGLIGLPMAARLAAAGWDVRGYDINRDRLRLAGERGIKPAASLEDALAGVRFVFTSLPNEQVLVELAPRLAGDAIWIETSTVGPAASAKAGQGRTSYLRAPISGSTALAEAGTLTTFVSGPKDAFEAARPALAAYSRAQIWVGEGDEARYAKLAVNLMVAVTAGMMGEALALAKSGGIDWSTMLDVIGDSVVASPLVKYKLEPLRRRDFTPAATGALVLKDLDLMIDAAREAGIELPLAEHVRMLYRGLPESRLAGEDFFSISVPNSVPGT